MDEPVKKIAILGSTGSIGRSTLDVVRADSRLSVRALSAHSNTRLLIEQARQFRPRRIVVTDKTAAADCDWSALPAGIEVTSGSDGIRKAVTDPEVDVVVTAIVGSAGMRGTWDALEAGKTVALANKETLVMAGPLVMDLASRRGSRIVPVDSEHSAIFQALRAGRSQEVKRIILTASGGPFRQHSREELANVSVDEALDHPTWNMGPKITVDSATMMNKALEMVEARWLFGLHADQIDVVIHPQSIVHSMVEFIDGSIIAQLGQPDMKLPIQYALTFPHRREGTSPRLDFDERMSLDFEPPDLERFPALELGREVARAGGTAGAVLNAANEAAVAGFLAGDLAFNEIVPACKSVLQSHPFESQPTLDELEKLDRWARQEVSRWIPC